MYRPFKTYIFRMYGKTWIGDIKNTETPCTTVNVEQGVSACFT